MSVHNDVNDDPCIAAALRALGRPVAGDYVLTQPLVLTKPDGRMKSGSWQAREGLAEGRVVQIRSLNVGREINATDAANVDYGYEIRLGNGYGFETAMIVWHFRTGARVTRCPMIREDQDDVEFAYRLLTSLAPRGGAAGLLSRIDPYFGDGAWQSVFMHLVEEGVVTEAQIRNSIAALDAKGEWD